MSRREARLTNRDIRGLLPLRVNEMVVGEQLVVDERLPVGGCLPVCLSFCLSVCLCVCVSVCLSVCLSVCPSAVLCTRCWEEPSSDLVGPTTPAERAALIAKLRNSRPGPSGWKLCFIEAFPAWVQEIYWLSLDVQRLVGCLAPSLNLAEQVHLPKPAGGWRPLSMLEESFKAIEAPVVRRLGSARSPWVPDVPFSSLNRAYVRGVSAAAEVLYTDTLVCEDSYRHQLPLLRVPADFEKFFNTLQLPLIDAMQQGRGFPDAVRRLHQALFASACVCLDTRVGLTPPPCRSLAGSRKAQCPHRNSPGSPKNPSFAFVHRMVLPTTLAVVVVSLRLATLTTLSTMVAA